MLNFEPYKIKVEDSYKDDFTTVSLSSAVKVRNITVTIYNDEDLAIKITNTGIYVSAIVDPESIKEEIMTDDEIKEYIDTLIDDYIGGGTFDLVIPLINSISEMADKPDGAIARCSWIQGVV